MTTSAAKHDLPPFQHYQVIDLPDGRTTPGINDLRGHVQLLGLDRSHFEGRTVLDIAANDGFWSFKAKELGASRVIGIDVDRYEDYDWGYGGCPPDLRGRQTKREVFDWINENYGFGCERLTASIYDLSPERFGTFDVAFCYGLLYHLRHPLLALDRLRSATTGFAVLQTHVINLGDPAPATLFFHDDVFFGPTNWTGPNTACVAHWLRDAGFERVYVDNSPTKGRRQGRVFVACVDGAPSFNTNQLTLLDDHFFAEARSAIQKVVGC